MTQTDNLCTTNDTVWILDSAASHHIAADLSSLHNPVPYRIGVMVDGGSTLYSTNKGQVRLVMDVNGREERVSFSNVFFVPGWNSGNLISLVLIMA